MKFTFPRMSGDDPHYSLLCGCVKFFSPHERG